MSNSTAEQAIRKVANSLINTHRPQLGACHSVAVESSLEILRGGQRPHIISVDMASGPDSTAVFQPPFAHELKGGAQ